MKIKEIAILFLQFLFVTTIIILPFVIVFSLADEDPRERIEIEDGTRVITMDGDTIEVHAYKFLYAYKVN